MKRPKYRVKTLNMEDYTKCHLEDFPSSMVNGSVLGMKMQYWGMDAKVVRCGQYYFNVSSEPKIYDEYAH